MISAHLLAEVDLKLREIVRKIGTMKQDGAGQDRSFGGLNVLFAEDFWQLDPPEGGFLGAIPTEYIKRGRQYHPAPTIAAGQALFWGRAFVARTRGSWRSRLNFATGVYRRTRTTFCMGSLLLCLAAGSTERPRAEKQRVPNLQMHRKDGRQLLEATSQTRATSVAKNGPHVDLWRKALTTHVSQQISSPQLLPYSRTTM